MGRRNEDPNGNPLRRPRARTQAGDVADWGTVDAEVLRKVIERASAKHGALRFGYTRDGGAYAIGVYAGDNYFTDYVRPSEDVEQYLTDLTASFADYDGTTSTAPAQTGSKRR